MIKKLVVVLASLFAFAINADLLYWQVDPNAHVNGVDSNHDSIYKFLNDVEWDGQTHVLAARIDVWGSDWTWLKTMESTLNGNSWDKFVDIGHASPDGSSIVGATASSTQWNNLGRNLYYQIAILAGEDHGTHYIWQELCWSAWFEGALLESEGSYDLTYTPPTLEEMSKWIPQEFYTYRPVPVYDYTPVPEPNACVLMLIGFGMICLRRKMTW